MKLGSFLEQIVHFVAAQFAYIRIADIFDMLFLSVIIFVLYGFLRDRRAANLMWGILILAGVWAISSLLGFTAISYLLRSVFAVGLLAIIIIFQPEIRTALEKVGDRPWHSLQPFGAAKETDVAWQVVDKVCEAAFDMAKPSSSGEYTGALIVIERSTKLGDIIRSGIEVDAQVNSFVLRNIFFKNSPMHDGAVVIRDGRVAAAGCMLPLTESTAVDPSLGTRHRAAIGISEVSDAVVVVVSEQTGSVSVAFDGAIQRDFSILGLKKVLSDKLIPKDTASKKK